MGIQTVIDLRISPHKVAKEGAFVRSEGLTFVNIPMGSDPPTPRQEQKFLQIVSQARTHPVFVHCEHGADRTGTMIGIYRRIDDHWSYARTYAEMRHYGFKPYYTQLSAVVKSAA
jgi:tyrosine-protein phosphatase SIW14